MQSWSNLKRSSRFRISILPILVLLMVPLVVAGQTAEPAENAGEQADQATAADQTEPARAEQKRVIKGKGIELHRLGEGEVTVPDAWAAAVISSREQRFTGEPISIVLSDAEIKDVLKTFASLTGLNIVIDPRVTGKVSLELHDVPWDQVIDLILKMKGYTYTIGDRVIIVHPA